MPRFVVSFVFEVSDEVAMEDIVDQIVEKHNPVLMSFPCLPYHGSIPLPHSMDQLPAELFHPPLPLCILRCSHCNVEMPMDGPCPKCHQLDGLEVVEVLPPEKSTAREVPRQEWFYGEGGFCCNN